MNPKDDPFLPLASTSLADDFGMLEQRQVANAPVLDLRGVLIGRLQGFDVLEQPLVGQLDACPGRVCVARSTVPLRNAMRGCQVVVMFERGDVERPVILGVLESHPMQSAPAVAAAPLHALVDGERHVIEAEREIVLRCGDASITLTRAGKVIIRGNYILSRSTGYNKIKGAAIDIN